MTPNGDSKQLTAKEADRVARILPSIIRLKNDVLYKYAMKKALFEAGKRNIIIIEKDKCTETQYGTKANVLIIDEFGWNGNQELKEEFE